MCQPCASQPSLPKAGGTRLLDVSMGRHHMACKGRRWHQGPRAEPVELINSFCSGLGVSFNIHQPVMKESSELSLNIDGAGRLTAGLGRLPPACTSPGPERLPACRDLSDFPRKAPM